MTLENCEKYYKCKLYSKWDIEVPTPPHFQGKTYFRFTNGDYVLVDGSFIVAIRKYLRKDKFKRILNERD